MSTASKEYAQALYELAASENLAADVLQNLEAVQTAFLQNEKYTQLLCNPAIKKAERLDLIDKSLADANVYVRNFVKILCEKSALEIFNDCVKDYRAQQYAAEGILPVVADSAIALSESQKDALTQKISKITGKKVVLVNNVDPSLVGGVRIAYDGIQIDGTVQGKLDNLRKVLLT